MKSKKIMSLVLAMVMALSLAVPAFAAGNTDNSLSQSTTVTGTTKTPTVKITVPATGNVVVNPYKMSVTIDGVTGSDQIVSAPQYIVNASEVPVKVSAAVNATVAGQAKLATKTLVGDTRTKTNSVYLFLQTKIVDNNTDPITWTGAVETIAAAKGTAKDQGTLAQGTGSAAASEKGYMAFRLNGDAVAEPTTAWTSDDKVDAVIAFTFIPGTFATAPSVSLAADATTLDDTVTTSTTVTATFDAGTSTGVTVTKYEWVSDDASATVSSADTGTTNNVTVNRVSAGTANITVTATLSDGNTVTDSIAITCT